MSFWSRRRSHHGIRLVLPARIAGIVFWGMVLVGLVFAAFITQTREHELVVMAHARSQNFSHQIESALLLTTHPDDLQRRLADLFRVANAEEKIAAMSLVYQDGWLVTVLIQFDD